MRESQKGIWYSPRPTPPDSGVIELREAVVYFFSADGLWIRADPQPHSMILCGGGLTPAKEG